MTARRPLSLLVTALAAVLAALTVPAGAAARPAQQATGHPVGAVPTAGVTATSDGGHVVAVQTRPTGITSVTIYDTAPGVSTDELYAMLRGQGVPGLVDPSGPQTLDSYQCYYGTAYALESGRCPAVKWRWNGFDDPQVYFRDHTPSQWPVSASVSKWHEAVGIDSYWISGGTACPSGGRHCVHVYSGNYGYGWRGRTLYSYDSYRYFIDGSVKVELNDYYSNSYDNRGNTCHQLGHALGVDHNTSTTSCMYSTSISGTDPMYPNSSDYGLLRYVIYP